MDPWPAAAGSPPHASINLELAGGFDRRAKAARAAARSASGGGRLPRYRVPCPVAPAVPIAAGWPHGPVWSRPPLVSNSGRRLWRWTTASTCGSIKVMLWPSRGGTRALCRTYRSICPTGTAAKEPTVAHMRARDPGQRAWGTGRYRARPHLGRFSIRCHEDRSGDVAAAQAGSRGYRRNPGVPPRYRVTRRRPGGQPHRLCPFIPRYKTEPPIPGEDHG